MIPTYENLSFVIKSQTIKCYFYLRCSTFLSKKPQKEKIVTIEESPYVIEPLRLYIKRQLLSTQYYFFLTDHFPLNIGEVMVRELPLHGEKVYRVLSFRLAIPLLKNPKYLVISLNDKVEGIQVESNYENISYLLGIASFDVIKYHNVDGIEGATLEKFREFAKITSPLERERLLITGDIQLDLLGHGNKYNPKIAGLMIGTGEAFKFMTAFKSKNVQNTKFRYVMSNTIFNDAFAKEGNFVNVLYNKGLPQYVGEQSILDILCNPQHHHHYMGIKLVCLDLLCFKYIKAATAMSYYNLLLLEKNVKYNNIKICFPNLVAEKDKVTIFTDEHIQKLTKHIQSLTKSNSINIAKCHDQPFEVYTNKPTRIPFAITILKYHGMFADYIMNKYFDKTSLLDIGSGPLRRIQYYEQIGFKHIVAIEPSENSIKLGKERFLKCTHLTLDYIQGVGDENWENSENYKSVIQHAPYKSILFKFTIHYMVQNFDIILQNIKRVADADDCTIVVTCVNSKKINENIGNSDKYEIFDGDMPVYGVYNIDKTDNDPRFTRKLFYFASVYGVENGSIEYLVDIDFLIDMFGKIGFYVEINSGFLDMNISELKHTLDKLSPLQKKIPELQHLLIFKNKSK